MEIDNVVIAIQEAGYEPSAFMVIIPYFTALPYMKNGYFYL